MRRSALALEGARLMVSKARLQATGTVKGGGRKAYIGTLRGAE